MTLEPGPAAALSALPLPPAISKRSVDETDSPATRTPSRLATPPPPLDRGRLQASRNGENASFRSARSSGRVSDITGGRGIDPDALSRALSGNFAADRRDSTPGASPSRKRQRINGDRSVHAQFSLAFSSPSMSPFPHLTAPKYYLLSAFWGNRATVVLRDEKIILNPCRFIPSRSGQDLQASFSLLHEEGSPATPSKQKKRTPHGELHFQRSMSSGLFDCVHLLMVIS